MTSVLPARRPRRASILLAALAIMGCGSSGRAGQNSDGASDSVLEACPMHGGFNPAGFSYVISDESPDSNVNTKAWSGTDRIEAISSIHGSSIRIERTGERPCHGTLEIAIGSRPTVGGVVTLEDFRANASTPNHLTFWELGDCRTLTPENLEAAAIWGSDGISGTLRFTKVGPITYETHETAVVDMMLAQVPVHGEAVDLQLENVRLRPLTTEENDGVPNPATGTFTLNGSLETSCFHFR